MVQVVIVVVVVIVEEEVVVVVAATVAVVVVEKMKRRRGTSSLATDTTTTNLSLHSLLQVFPFIPTLFEAQMVLLLPLLPLLLPPPLPTTNSSGWNRISLDSPLLVVTYGIITVTSGCNRHLLTPNPDP